MSLQWPGVHLSVGRSWLQPHQLRLIYIAALIVTQVANVVGSLYLKVAMNSSSPPNPVTFALYREVMAGVLLTTFATGVQGTTMKASHIPMVAALGLCLFLNQLLFILGLHLSGVTLAACMQPTIPVFTALLSMVCGQETASARRISGTIIAALGATAMVYGTSMRSRNAMPPGPPLELFAAQPSGSHTPPEQPLRALSMSNDWSALQSLRWPPVESTRVSTPPSTPPPHIFPSWPPPTTPDSVHGSAVATHAHMEPAGSLYWHRKGPWLPETHSLIGRDTLEAESSSITGGDSFLGALCLVGNCVAMGGYFVLARRLSGEVPAAALTGWAYLGAAAWMTLVATIAVPRAELVLPASSRGPLLYWVLIVSILGYSILTSATSILVATHVAAFISVQPVAGAALGWAAFGEQLHAWDSGAGLIVLGLFLVTGGDSDAASGGRDRAHSADRVV